MTLETRTVTMTDEQWRHLECLSESEAGRLRHLAQSAAEVDPRQANALEDDAVNLEGILEAIRSAGA